MRTTAPENDEAGPGNELAVCLWVVAALVGVLELTWWFFDRLYSI